MVHPAFSRRIEEIERKRKNEAVCAKFKIGDYHPSRVQESDQPEPQDAPVINLTPATELVDDYVKLIENLNSLIEKQNASLKKLKDALHPE